MYKLIITSILLIAFTCKAKAANCNFVNLSTKDGLSSNWIFDIYRDSNGLLWIATNAGINVYNGYNTKTYLHNPDITSSITSNQILKIFEDSRGQIWIGTSGGGVCVYIPEIDGFKKIDISADCKNSELSFSTVFDILEVDNILYFATENSGFIQYLPDSNDFNYFFHSENDSNTISSNCIRSLIYAKGSIWLATASCYIDKFNLQSATIERIPIPELESIASENFFLDLKHLGYQSTEEKLWIGSETKGLWSYSLINKEFVHYSTSSKVKIAYNAVHDIIVYDKQLWIATNNGGVNIMDNTGNIHFLKANQFDKNALSSDGIYKLHTDKEGNLFVGTFDAGIDIYSKAINRLEYFYETSVRKSGIRNINVADIATTTDGTIWLASQGNGLNTFNSKTKEIKRFYYPQKSYAINGDFISAVYADNFNNLYISSFQEGFTIYNTITQQAKNYRNTPNCSNCPGSNKAWAFHRSADSMLWISFLESGIQKLDLISDSFFELTEIKKELFKLNDYKVYDITEVNGVICFATKNAGLHMYFKQTDSLAIINTSTTPALSNNSLKSVVSDSNGNLWIGTENGVNMLNIRTFEITVYYSNAGNKFNFVQDIVIDNKNRIWLSTLGGICKLNHIQKSIELWQPMPLMYNNAPNITSSLYDQNGYIYFGGNSGFHRFHPDSVEDIWHNPKIRFTSFQIFNKDSLILENGILKHINSVSTIHVNEKNKMFSIGFAVPNILMENIIKYRYKLENFSSDWIVAGDDRKATFTGLEGGKYIFMVQSSDIQGNWLDETRKLTIIVHPPFIKTWFFKATLFLFILGLVWAIYKVRLKILTKQRNDLEKLVKERTNLLEESYQEISAQNEEITAQNEENAKQNDLIVRQNTELQTHRNNLEELVEERTNELKLAKEKAEESDHLKTSFIQNISHEIRTPLNAIVGFSSLLPENFDNKKTLEDFSKIIDKRSNDLLDIINDILDISIIDSVHNTLNIEPCNINELFIELNQFFDGYKVRLNKQHINVLFQILPNDSILTAQTDKLKLKQIIINLVSNAIKFTENGSVICECKYENGKLLFLVRDTGIGIPADKFEYIFDRFSKIAHPTNQNLGGTGLGLSIVKELVRLLGGNIWLDSECNKGTTFYFSINYLSVDTISNNLQTIGPIQEYSSNNTILIVEDDFYNAQYLKEILKNVAHNIITVTNGLSAIKIVEQQKIDVILMDICLPDITGYEAAKLILKINPNIKIIAQTANAASADHNKSIEAGCVNYICKPINRESLLVLMKQYLS